MPVSNMQEYWSTKHNSRISFFRYIYKNSIQSNIFFHLKTPNSESKNLKARIQRVSIYLDSKFSEHFIPGKNICVDESIIKFKGKISFIATLLSQRSGI